MKTNHPHGQRLTRQRRLVLQIIQGSQQHLDAEHIHQLAKASDARISLATIYRALAFLKETGLVQEHRLGEGHAHFEPLPARPHYHFTCKKCGRVIEFEAPQLLEIIQAVGASHDLQVMEVHLLLSGYCAGCRS